MLFCRSFQSRVRLQFYMENAHLRASLLFDSSRTVSIPCTEQLTLIMSRLLLVTACKTAILSGKPVLQPLRAALTG